MTQKEIDKFLANTKVYVNGKSKEIQEKLLSLGYKWCDGYTEVDDTESPFLYIYESKFISGNNMVIFSDNENREITPEDILSLELTKSKFDPKTLQPFDKVLIRRGNENYNVWFPDFVSDPPNGANNKTLCMCIGEDIAMVIPYNDETKHLVGTTDEAPEYYRYWED